MTSHRTPKVRGADLFRGAVIRLFLVAIDKFWSAGLFAFGWSPGELERIDVAALVLAVFDLFLALGYGFSSGFVIRDVFWQPTSKTGGRTESGEAESWALFA